MKISYCSTIRSASSKGIPMKPFTKSLLSRFESGCAYPMITAHSGCENTPDNSLEHIQAAISSGAEAFEIDIHMEENGVLILTHDVPKGCKNIPTLSEAFELTAAHPTICVNCDVKEEFLKAPVIALAREYGLESRIVFTGSYSMDEIPDLAASDADWWINVFHASDDEINGAFEKYASLENEYRVFNLSHSMINPEYAARAASCGYYFSVWTVNTEEALRRMMQYSEIVNITTRFPKLALEIRKEIFGK